MIGADDLAQMKAAMAAARGDNLVSITIRRGATTLAAQSVRITKGSAGAAWRQGQAGRDSRAQVTVHGSETLNIAVDDRFTLSSVVYQVVFVRPGRMVSTQAIAEAVE